MILIQAIRNAMVNDLVVPNVADLAAVPAGMPGRPSSRSTWSRLVPCWTQPGHQLRPVTCTATTALGPLFESRGKTNGGQS